MPEDVHTVQIKYAAQLRAEAINHLRTSKLPVASSFRGDYFNIEQKHHEVFLDKQSINKEWGTYLELCALAEKNNQTIMVTCQNSGKESTFCLYRGSDNADVLHLENWNNTHWGVHGQTHQFTSGDGNCLYNAYAQARYLSATQPKTINILLLKLIADADSPEDRKQAYQADLDKLMELKGSNPDVYAQIQEDYIFALQLATKGDSSLFYDSHQIIKQQIAEADFYLSSVRLP